MKIILVIATMLFVQTSFAKTEKIFATVKRSTPEFEESMGFTLKGDKVLATSNSNFLTTTFPYHFGLYEIKLSDEPSLKEKIKKLADEEVPSDVDVYVSPHEQKVFVSNVEVPVNSPKFGQVLEIIKIIFESKKLKLIKGVTIQNEKSMNAIKCNEVVKNLCIFEYGSLHR